MPLPGTEHQKTAFHGLQLYGLYSIMFHGGLRPSSDRVPGARTAFGPGIYLHKGKKVKKAVGYAGYHDLFRDGIFWAALLEVRCDWSRRVILEKKTDQWVQEDGSVELEKLWNRAVSVDDL